MPFDVNQRITLSIHYYTPHDKLLHFRGLACNVRLYVQVSFLVLILFIQVFYQLIGADINYNLEMLQIAYHLNLIYEIISELLALVIRSSVIFVQQG